jgi:tripartite-type tricarboxylate transporter receptor subunit TctC
MKSIGSLIAGALMLAATALPAGAQSFPTKPVTIVVIVAGGPMSALARLMGDQLEKVWKQPVIVEHKPGAGGLIASEQVKRATADGHTLLFSADAMTGYRLFNKNTDFDPARDLTPISLIAEANFAVFVNAQTPGKTLKEFVDHAKANPGKLNYAVLPQSQQQLESMRFLKDFGIEMAMVPYAGGSSQVLPALLSNDVQMYLASYSSMAQHMKTGALRPLASFSEQRQAEMPDVPTLKELGSSQVAAFWYAFFAPPGTPAAITGKISQDMQQVMALQEMKDRVQSLGLQPRAMNPEQLAARLKLDTDTRARIAREANIQPQ